MSGPPLRITYGPWGRSLAELAAAASAAERGGAQVVWAPELHRSATVSVAAMASATERAAVGTAIMLAFTRSPMTIALEAMDLDELSGGRFILGLGTGVQRLNELWHNARWGKPAAHLREVVRDVRAFWAAAARGEDVDLDGSYEPMHIKGYRRPFDQERVEIPIYLASMGPVMTRLVGEIGDGWISHELISPGFLRERIMPGLREGIAGSARNPNEFDVVVSAVCAVDQDRGVARRCAAGTVGFYASVRTYADFFDFHGFAEEQAHIIERFRSIGDAEGLADVVPGPMIDELTVSGTPEDLVAGLQRYEGLATSIKLTPPTHGVDEAQTRECQNWIIKAIAEYTGA